MKIKQDELKIVGNWIFDGSKMVEDEGAKRIDWLRTSYLKKIATDESGWLTLYQDPEDKRYWELIYEQGEMQGGGPPSLIFLPVDKAREKYDIKD